MRTSHGSHNSSGREAKQDGDWGMICEGWGRDKEESMYTVSSPPSEYAPMPEKCYSNGKPGEGRNNPLRNKGEGRNTKKGCDHATMLLWAGINAPVVCHCQNGLRI